MCAGGSSVCRAPDSASHSAFVCVRSVVCAVVCQQSLLTTDPSPISTFAVRSLLARRPQLSKRVWCQASKHSPRCSLVEPAEKVPSEGPRPVPPCASPHSLDDVICIQLSGLLYPLPPSSPCPSVNPSNVCFLQRLPGHCSSSLRLCFSFSRKSK